MNYICTIDDESSTDNVRVGTAAGRGQLDHEKIRVYIKCRGQ